MSHIYGMSNRTSGTFIGMCDGQMIDCGDVNMIEPAENKSHSLTGSMEQHSP